MSTDVSLETPLQRFASLINNYLLPLGWFIVLTGMFWAWDRTVYHKLFYIFLAAPTLVILIKDRALLKPLVSNPILVAFLVFSAYTLISIAWSDTENSASGLIKRPLYIAMLLLSAGIISLRSPTQLEQWTRWAAMLVALAAGLSLAFYLYKNPVLTGRRLLGYGALYNPLLTAHVFGAFAAFWLASWFQATLGKRLRVNQRGLSWRPAIWMDALRQIGEHPWLGHGFDSPMTVIIPGLGRSLADPHNIELGVLYAGGIVGFAMWMTLYGLAMYFCWTYRKHPGVMIAATWLIFGFASGLTEGSAFMSRPKEHWFLIWIPMALVYGQSLIHWKRSRSA